MDTVLLIIQVLVGIAFIAAGAMKLARSREQLAPQMAWVEDFSDTQVKGIGALELLGGIGVLSPFLGSSFDLIGQLAAIGLLLTMIGAAYTHFRRGETNMIPVNAVLGVLAAIVAFVQ